MAHYGIEFVQLIAYDFGNVIAVATHEHSIEMVIFEVLLPYHNRKSYNVFRKVAQFDELYQLVYMLWRAPRKRHRVF